MPEEIRFGVEDSILNGNGAGQPLCILNSNAVSERDEGSRGGRAVTIEIGQHHQGCRSADGGVFGW